MKKHMKKRIVVIVIVVLLCGSALYSHFGWLHDNDDILNYIARNCDIDGKEIVDGEYISSTGDLNGNGTKLFRVIADDGKTLLVRLDVVYRKNFGMIGPKVRVKDIEVWGIGKDYEKRESDCCEKDNCIDSGIGMCSHVNRLCRQTGG